MIGMPSKETISMGIGAVAGIIFASLVWISYNAVIGHPKVAQEARTGYVVLSEKTALETTLKLAQKRAADAERLSAQHAAALEKADALNAAEMTRLEQENTDYEERLKAAGRRCELDGADLDWLRQP